LSSGRELRTFTVFLLIILAVVPLYAIAGSETHPAGVQQGALIGNLQLRSVSLDVTGLNANGMGLSLDAVVFNPNGFGATLEAANYSIYADGHYLGEGLSAADYVFASRTSQTLVFPVTVAWGSALWTTGSYIGNLGNVDWKANGTARIEVGGLSLSVSFEFATG